MEKITNIEIKNFKSIRHQKIDGCKRINVFIGYPNVGKSNILEALSLFSIDESNKAFSDFIRIDGLTTIFYNGEISNPLEIIINSNRRYTGEYFTNTIIFHEEGERQSGGFKEVEDKTKEVLSGAETVDLKKLRKKLLIDRGFFHLNIKDEQINVGNSNLPDFESYELNPNEIRIIKYDFKKYKKDVNDIFYDDQLQHPSGLNIFNVISKNEDLRREATSLFKLNGLNFSFDKTSQEFKILKFVNDEIVLIPYSLTADTLQRLIFYKATIKSNKNSTLLFEEPEAHMFPPYIKELTSDIIFDKNDNQYFIATHSPFVLNELIEEAQEELSVYVVDYDKGETIIKRLTDEEVTEISQYGIDLFFNLESYLEKNGQPHSA